MATSTKLSFKEKLGYGLGDTASHFVWDMVGFWLLLFYTDILGLTPAVAGTIMLIARVWDMIFDPVMGVLSDRTNTRWGKFRPYLLWMALPYAVVAVLTFLAPDFGADGKAVWAAVTYLLLMTVFTAINLPYSSLAGVMTADETERTSLNQFRFVSAFGGQLIVSGLAMTLCVFFAQLGESGPSLDYQQLSTEAKASGIRTTMILFGVISVILFLLTFKWTQERVHPPHGQKSDLKADVKNVLGNRPWLILFIVGALSFTLFAMQNSVTAFYFKDYIRDAEQAQLFNVVGTLALILAVPLARPLAKRLGKRMVFIVCSLLTGLWNLLLFIPGPDQLWLVYVIIVLSKLSYAPTVPLLWTMIADTADYSEWKTGRRATGLFFSAATLSMKLGWGVGGFAAGLLLAQFGYEPKAAVQTQEALTGIKLMMTVFPGVLYIAAAGALLFYGLDRKTETLMRAELEARRERDKVEEAALTGR